MPPTTREREVFVALCRYGMRQHWSQLGRGEKERQFAFVQKLLLRQEGVPTQALVEAIRFGMPKVWPHSQEGYFDGSDLLKSIEKAKAVAARERRAGRIPVLIDEVRRRRALVEGDDDGE